MQRSGGAIIGERRNRRTAPREGTTIWHRYHREGIVDNIPVAATGTIPQIVLSPSAPNQVGIVTGVDDPEIALEGVIHDLRVSSGQSLPGEPRTKGALGDRSKDERWIFQPRLLIADHNSEPIFVAKDFRADPLLVDDDGEAAINALLYRHARDSLPATAWLQSGMHQLRMADERRSLYGIHPEHETFLIPPSERTGGATLDMKLLAETTTPATLAKMLEPMVANTRNGSRRHRGPARRQRSSATHSCRDAEKSKSRPLHRMRHMYSRGSQLLQSDERVEAFDLQTDACGINVSTALLGGREPQRGSVEGTPLISTRPESHMAPFQMGFILP